MEGICSKFPREKPHSQELVTAAFDQPGKKENGIVQMMFRKFKDPE
jgi:hypothetical protein